MKHKVIAPTHHHFHMYILFLLKSPITVHTCVLLIVHAIKGEEKPIQRWLTNLGILARSLNLQHACWPDLELC